jgi:hypothetical protein
LTLHPARIQLGLLPDPEPGEPCPLGVMTPRKAGWHCAFVGLSDHPVEQDVPRADWLVWAVVAEGATVDARAALIAALGLDLGRCGSWAHADAVAAANHVAFAVAQARVSLELVQAVTGRRRCR